MSVLFPFKAMDIHESLKIIEVYSVLSTCLVNWYPNLVNASWMGFLSENGPTGFLYTYTEQ